NCADQLPAVPGPHTGNLLRAPACIRAVFHDRKSRSGPRQSIRGAPSRNGRGAREDPLRAAGIGIRQHHRRRADCVSLHDWCGEARGTRVRCVLDPLQPCEEAVAAPADKNYLFAELIAQIHRQPLRWRLIVIVAKPGDPTHDPSIGWPADRERVDVGTLTLDRVEAEELSTATDIVFNPLMLPAGMAPSDDPVVRARSAAYVESFSRGVGEAKQPSAITPADVEKREN